MNKCDELYDSMVLKYVKKHKPTPDEFQKYADETYYGFEPGQEDYECRYRDRGMITSGENDELILTAYGKATLKKIQLKRRKDRVQIFVPIGALLITITALVYSIIFT